MNEQPTKTVAQPAIAKNTELIKIAREYLDKLLGPGFEQAGAAIQDTVKYWRFKNQVNIVLKAKTFLEKKGINPKVVLPKTLVPILEYGSVEQVPTMQEKWAALLANAADPNRTPEITPFFPDILKQLSPAEAKLLDIIYDQIKGLSVDEVLTAVFFKKDCMAGLGISSYEHDLLIANLFRLGLCQSPQQTGIVIGSMAVAVNTKDPFSITIIGYELVKACRME